MPNYYIAENEDDLNQHNEHMEQVYLSETDNQNAQPIPRKAFDVASVESPNMHDMDQPYIRNNDDGTITIDGKIDKYLVIVIAKALGVTAEDFK